MQTLVGREKPRSSDNIQPLDTLPEALEETRKMPHVTASLVSVGTFSGKRDSYSSFFITC